MGVIGSIHGSYVHSRRVRQLTAHIAALMPPAATVLDVGAGDGKLARLLLEQRPDLKIEGVDPLVRPETAIPVTAFDGKRLPYPDRSFDVVLFVDVLHHTDDPAVLLREAARVARHGVVIKDHTRHGQLSRQILRFMDYIGNARHGVSIPADYWTQDRWDQAFAAIGLKKGIWNSKLGLYPWWAAWLFERGLHFLAYLSPVAVQTAAVDVEAVGQQRQGSDSAGGALRREARDLVRAAQ